MDTISTRQLLVTLLLLALPPLCAANEDAAAVAGEASNAVTAIQRLPLLFEENAGQFDPRARFVARGPAYDAFLTDEGATLVIGKREGELPAAVEMRFAGQGSQQPGPIAQDPLASTTNYFIDDDASRFVTDVRTFARVRYESVYRGIDVVYYGNDGRLEYDVVVAPGANPCDIGISFRGSTGLGVSAHGSLLVHTAAGDLEFGRPVAYQEIDGERRQVSVRYSVGDDDRVGFRLGKYDVDRALVIDPMLTTATQLWGQGPIAVALDAASNIYVVGTITTADLPASAGYQRTLAGTKDAYVAKLNPTGTSVIYASYLGARRANTYGFGIAVDASGSAYITGQTDSNAFPVTAGAFRTAGPSFVTKLNASGNALAYSTFVEASAKSIAVDGAGSVYMTGSAGYLSTTPGVFQPTSGQPTAYASKLNPTGTAMTYQTYLGGSANDEGKGIAVDSAGNAYVVGVARSTNFPLANALQSTLRGTTDAFVAKINASASALLYSTYLGGSFDERGFGIAVDSAGQAVVTGWTKSVDFPVTAGAFQPSIGRVSSSHTISNAFVSKLNAAGNGFVYSSYLGGAWCFTAANPGGGCIGFFGPDDGIDAGTSVAVDAAGHAYVGGYATSLEFPQVDPLETVAQAGGGESSRAPFVAEVVPDGSRLIYSSVIGPRESGTVNQLAVDNAGNVVAVGSSGGFLLTSNPLLGSGITFLARLGHGNFPTTVRSSANPAGRAQSITLTAAVLNPSAGSVVTFKDGATTLGNANSASGSATIAVSLSPGIHAITATNSADGKVSPTYFQLVTGQ